jgi:hypothetical protein
MNDTTDLKKQLKAAIAAYHKATENADSFETKLREAKKAEADALTDDDGDEKRLVKAIGESQGLQAVFSRRLELARAKVPEAFAVIQPIVIDADGNRALIASQVAGLLAATVNTDELPEPPWELSGRIAIYTAGRFLWRAVREANPAFIFDQVSVDLLKSRGISFEPTFSGVMNYWVGRP